jgi:hypothetical protein
MGITYGKVTSTSYSDPEVIAVNRCLERFGQAVLPGAYLVDTYPILQYVPGYLTQLKEWHREELALFEGQLDTVRKQMVITYEHRRLRDSLIETGRGHSTALLRQISDREPARTPDRRQGDGIRGWCHVRRWFRNRELKDRKYHFLYALSGTDECRLPPRSRS